MSTETAKDCKKHDLNQSKMDIDSGCELRSSRQSDLRSSALKFGSLLRTWADVSKINYFSSHLFDVIKSGQSIRRKSIGISPEQVSIQCFVPTELRNKTEEDLFEEQFPNNVTALMNEDQHWGCFYTFPELYDDLYSPVVRVRDANDVPPLVEGILTRDMVTPHLTYLKRTPILGDFVYIKLDLSSKNLRNIEVLQHYKYLVYLNLTSNFLKDLSVLSHLLYLQYLSVSFNRLTSVLEYDTAQWFLTEVHYKYNAVKVIRDLTMFWSITILDLSHNNIKRIDGLENLMYLRRLDLSFNHIQRLENLNNLRLLWLDLSSNNISSFESCPTAGLWTLYHLEYLNISENNLTSMKIFRRCTRLRELHARNNRFNLLLELAVYMRQLRRLIVLDLRENPVCSVPSYKDVVFNTFPALLSLDSVEIDPEDLSSAKMAMAPDINTFASRRLLRLLYVEQLRRARVSPYTPPADSTDVPIVVIVGYEAVGKGTLVRRLASECSSHIQLALQHTTAKHHFSDHYKQVNRKTFDDMVLSGDMLTYSEMYGESYGLSRAEAVVKDAKVKIVSMDLLGALMLKHRGLKPYLILAYSDRVALLKRQQERKMFRMRMYEKKEVSYIYGSEKTILQMILSGRLLVSGIINDIILSLEDEEYNSRFVFDSDCSLVMEDIPRSFARTKGCNVNQMESSSTSIGVSKLSHNNQMDESMCSLFKGSQFTNLTCEPNEPGVSILDASASKRFSAHNPQSYKQVKASVKSIKSARHSIPSATFKGNQCATKSVTFVSNETTDVVGDFKKDISGMILETNIEKGDKEAADKSKDFPRSVSAKLVWPTWPSQSSPCGSDLDLWLTFLVDTGLLQASEATVNTVDYKSRSELRMDDPDSIIKELDLYRQVPYETDTTSIRDDYEEIHLKCPGLFWDTVTMDDPEKAFQKTKRIIRNIVNTQNSIKPMFDIDFVNTDLPTVQQRLEDIHKQIAPQRLFY